MNSELNRPMLRPGLLHYSNEVKNNKKWSFTKRLWQEKLSCKTIALDQRVSLSKMRCFLKSQEGNAGIGSILVCFFLLIMIIVPLNMGIQEVLSYRLVLQEHQVATEKVCFDTVLSLNANALSESEMTLSTLSLDAIERNLSEYLFHTYELEHLKVTLTRHLNRDQINVEYTFDYVTRFIFKDRIKKTVEVSLAYDLPLDR